MSETRIISDEEFLSGSYKTTAPKQSQEKNQAREISDEEFLSGSYKKSIDYSKYGQPQEKQERPFAAQNPNLYGAWGAVKETVKSVVPYLKYVDPEERKRFVKMSQQDQTRELLLQDLEAVTIVGAGPILKGAKALKPIAQYGALKHFPKTYAKIAELGGKLGETKVGKGVSKIGEELTKKRMVRSEKPAEIIPPKDEVVENIVRVIKEAKPIRKQQEAIYTKTRGERIAEVKKVGAKIEGEAGYHAKLSKMKGTMEKVEFDSIRKQVGQADMDDLFTRINDAGKLDEFEKLTAGRGLSKIFGEHGGTVPTEKELELLGNVFGQEFTKTILSKQPLFTKAKALGLEIANIPRSLMASYDLSAPLRQGVFLIGRPKQFAPAFKDMFKHFFSEKSYKSLMEGIATRPTYKVMKESNLALTDIAKGFSAREEEFMSSLAEKIPIIGKGVRMSGRAYTGFLNKLRADVFDDIVKKGAELGIDDPKFLKDTAKFINTATGRGGLGPLEGSATILNTTLFSPRLVASRLHLLNPVFYAKLHPQARKEALKSLFTFGATATTVASLAKMGGAEIGVDPRSADFMKVKLGNTRFDILGGFQQPIRTAAQFISGKIVSSTTGKTMTMGEGYKPLTRTQVLGRFFESKEAPVVSLATAIARGRNTLGEKTDVPTEVMNRLVPMVAQDLKELHDEQGAKGLPAVIPAIFGVGVQTYGGVSSYGLKGKEYPELNKELSRLKTSMGYPSSSAFGQELTLKEYKKLKEQTGKAIAKELTETMNSEYYKSANDRFKVKIIERDVDMIKQEVKRDMFPEKQDRSKSISHYKNKELMTQEEAEEAADQDIKNENK